MTVDLTLAITAHSETYEMGPCIRSAEAAIAMAEQAGYIVERLIGADAATADCQSYLDQKALSHWKLLHLDYRDQGKTRNALAREAAGKYLAFLDADDLFSENWLVEALETLKADASEGARTIVHPEINWQFDAHNSVSVNLGLDDPLQVPGAHFIQNPYDALCLAPREAWLEVPFPDREIQKGYAFEDWQWALETIAQGWNHIVAKDTIIFKRVRESSKNSEARQNYALLRQLDYLAIDSFENLDGRNRR